MAEGLVIRPVRPDDAAAIAGIYNHYIRETIITFEEVELGAAEMARRIAATTPAYPWLAGEVDGALIGYACAGRYQERSAYRFSAASSIYLDHRCCGKGLGRPLYSALLERLGLLGLHTVLGVITVPNPASMALHEKLGFRQVGHAVEVGYKLGRWLDVAYVQRMLDTR